MDEELKNLSYVELMTIANHLNISFVLLDSQYRLQRWNNNFTTFIVDETEKSLKVGLLIQDIAPALWKNGISQMVEELITTDKNILQLDVEYPFSRKKRYINMVLFHNSTEEYLLLIRNNTECRELERLLLQSDRLATLGSLVAGVAHEIRNPLSSIKLGVDILVMSIPESERRERILHLIVGGIDSLTNFVNNLLDFSRTKEASYQLADINEVLEHSLFFAQAKIQRNQIQVVKEYTQMDEILLDIDSLEHVFLNIILNAVEAMNQNGVLTLRTKKTSGSEFWNLPDADDLRDMISVEISDTGPGIPDDVRQRMFDSFFTTKKGGTGLGLAICDKIIHQHAGTIDVNSEIGKGTTFSIHLPALES